MKTCTQCSADFEVTKEDLKFYDKISPVFAGQKFNILSPKKCPECRYQNRIAFRNERKLYQRKCDATGRSIISIYSPDTPYIVYDQEVWWGDEWSGLDYGRNFDFSKTTTQQIQELYADVPHASLYTTNVENSYYTNFALNQKNCYLIFGAGNNEDCMNGKFIVDSKDVFDGLAVYSSELSYEGVSSEKCHGCKFFTNCRNCSECLMVEDCSACKNCIGCFGLRNKQYCVFNTQYSKQDYKRFAQEYVNLTQKKIFSLKNGLNELKAELPHVSSHIYNSENCTGESIYNSKNCLECFDCNECEDSKYMGFVPRTVRSYDCNFCAPDGNKFCYNVCSAVGLEDCIACFFTWYCHNIYYSRDCHHSHDLFACVGLKNQKYCILNKQYSKEEYHQLAAKIAKHMQEIHSTGSTSSLQANSGQAGEWGEYFPISISPFAYNETIAHEYFPLTKEEVLQKGWKWKEEEEPGFSDVTKNIPAQKLPESIADIPDDILNWAIECEESGRFFKIQKGELEFYRKMDLPIPHLHPDIRHHKRLALRNPAKIWERKCDKCQKSIQTTYSPERPETIYCEECYLAEVY